MVLLRCDEQHLEDRLLRADRDGFTIIEIMLAVLLLSFVVMGFQAVTGEIIHFSAQSNRESEALQLVEDRLELVRMHPGYADLDTVYAGVESDIGGHAGFTRTTVVSDAADTLISGIVTYKRITVTVDAAGLQSTISRTISVAAP